MSCMSWPPHIQINRHVFLEQSMPLFDSCRWFRVLIFYSLRGDAVPMGSACDPFENTARFMDNDRHLRLNSSL